VCLRSPAARTEVRTFCWRAWHIYKTMEHVRLVNYEMGLPVPLLATPLNYLSGDESDAEQIKEARTNRSKRPGLVSSLANLGYLQAPKAPARRSRPHHFPRPRNQSHNLPSKDDPREVFRVGGAVGRGDSSLALRAASRFLIRCPSGSENVFSTASRVAARTASHSDSHFAHKMAFGCLGTRDFSIALRTHSGGSVSEG
jgi:hypothetical protein